ncbi:MAG TPA: carboxypeptidase-like regulatory domain-containing protein, partial [Bryobacteraceae bacterium]
MKSFDLRHSYPLAVLLCSSVFGWAQSTSTGTVSGLVTDQQNAAIVGAEVRLVDVQTNTPRSTVTNETGRYSFINVTPGSYDITVSKPGFSQSKITAQSVEVGLTVTVDVALQIGSTATTVEVTAGAGAELQVMSATVGSTIS